VKFANAVYRGVLLGILGLAAPWALAAPSPLKLTLSRSLSPLMSEIRYADREPEEAAYVSRILVLGEKMRMDYGKDDAGFVLFDRAARMVWHVSPGDRRLSGIAAGKVGDVWPPDWKLARDEMPSEQGVLSQVRLNDVLCVEFKSAPMLFHEATLLADFRRLLAANQAKAWRETPPEARKPCALALDVHAAGIEYSQGLPLAIRYWDGRTRVHLGHATLPPRPELFELPAGYTRFVVGGPEQARTRQENSSKRQPAASQAR